MIEKERLKELAYKGARLYSVDTKHRTIFSFNIHCGLNGEFMITDDQYQVLSKCVESQEEAERILGENK